MSGRSDPWRSLRWPLLLLGVAILGVLIAVVLDRTPQREYALVIGGPALTVLLPIGLGWLLIAVLARARRNR